MKPEIVIAGDAHEFAATAAAMIVRAGAAAKAARGCFTLVLSGGHTPGPTYDRLAAAAPPATLDWSRTYLFFGDERFVPHDDPRSNYQMVRRSLLDRAPIAADHVLPIDTTGADAAACAVAYSGRLQVFFDLAAGAPPPAFDMVLLGLGDDGHTASLFPGAAALEETQRWVTASPPGTLPPPVDRITMTYPLLNAARQVLFLVAGESKAEPLRDVLQGGAPPKKRPAAGVRPTAGTVTWLVDRAAASLLAT